MKYQTLKSIFSDWEKKQKALPVSERQHLTAHITFTSDSFTKPYSETGRTYVISSDNKAFQSDCGGYSIFASCLDGLDENIRLEAYMKEEKGGCNGWEIEKCKIV